MKTKPLSFVEYQASVERTMNPSLSFKEQISNWSMGLAGEVGEVIEPLKKSLFHGKTLDLDVMRKELGDVLFYLVAMCNTLNLSIEEVAAFNKKKLEERYPNGFVPGGGIRNSS